jgi:hypothetical protein
MDTDALKNPSPNLPQNLVDLSFVIINNISIGIYQINWLRQLHKLCATFSASININYRLPIKVYYVFVLLDISESK